ncbi:MAG: phospholipase, partial [Solirubrobacteraceae bacterium]
MLGGFSQGACVVAELAARRPRPWAGVAVLTGALLGIPAERAMPVPGVTGLEMLFASSRSDE